MGWWWGWWWGGGVGLVASVKQAGWPRCQRYKRKSLFLSSGAVRMGAAVGLYWTPTTTTPTTQAIHPAPRYKTSATKLTHTHPSIHPSIHPYIHPSICSGWPAVFCGSPGEQSGCPGQPGDHEKRSLSLCQLPGRSFLLPLRN